MLNTQISYQNQLESQGLMAGIGVQDSIIQYHRVIQPQNDIQYSVLVTVGGLLLALVACFYIYYKFRSVANDSTSQEKRDSEETHFDIRQLENRLSAIEKRHDTDTNELWKANEKFSDRLLEIHAIVGEIRGMLSVRRVERD